MGARSRRVFSIKCKISRGSSINCIPIRRVAGRWSGKEGVHLNTSGLKIKYYRGKGPAIRARTAGMKNRPYAKGGGKAKR